VDRDVASTELPGARDDDDGRHGRGDQTAERQETDAGRRVRGSGQLPGNRHTQPDHARSGQETLHRLRSAHAGESRRRTYNIRTIPKHAPPCSLTVVSFELFSDQLARV